MIPGGRILNTQTESIGKKGDIEEYMKEEILIVIGVMVLIGGIAWAILFQQEQNDAFNTWSDNCINQGGIVFKSGIGFVHERYTCHLSK